jgi:predicted nucleic acid-binding protein
VSAVVDASLLVAATSDAGEEGRWAEDVVRAGGLVAPHLALVEATNILRRLEIEGRLNRVEAGAAARDLHLFDLELVPFTPFAERAEKGFPLSSAWHRR